jgi:hypothetical protein
MNTEDKGDGKPYLTKSTHELDLEARREAGFETVVKPEVDSNVVHDSYAVEGNDTSAYVGVDFDKMTYANDTEAPLKGDGWTDKAGDELLANYAYAKGYAEQVDHTLGTGSSDPLVQVVTSGKKVEHQVVEVKKVEEAGEDRGKQLAAAASPKTQKNASEPVKAEPQRMAPNTGDKSDTKNK